MSKYYKEFLMSKHPESLSSQQSHRPRAVRSSTVWGLSYPAIECGSLPSFLALLREPTTVLLAPLTLSIPVAASRIWQYAVHLTAWATVAGEQAILYATFAAAEHSECGGSGCLLFPCREKQETLQHLSERAHELQEGLLWCLTRVLEGSALVDAVQFPARYRLPDEWVWFKGSLAESGITFTIGHWTLTDPLASETSTAFSVQQMTAQQEDDRS